MVDNKAKASVFGQCFEMDGRRGARPKSLTHNLSGYGVTSFGYLWAFFNDFD
jgi:hypothetical protein